MLSLFALLACATVDPGTVVVEVPVCDASLPYSVIRQGRYWFVSQCTDYKEIPSREQRAVWAKANTQATVDAGEGGEGDESISFAGKDGQAVNVDVAVGYAIAPSDAEIITLVKTFGYDVAGTVRSRVRDSVRNALSMCASGLTVDDIYGEGKRPLFECVEKTVQAEYAPKGLVITRLTLNSDVRLPDTVRDAMQRATAATQDAQRVEREVASAEAEGKKAVATAKAAAEAKLAGASAEAESNRLIASSITPELVRMRELEIEAMKAEKWNGALPIVSGGSGSSQMLLDVGAVAAGRDRKKE